MVDYNIVKFCRLCKTRFVVPKKMAKKYYCDKCQVKIDKQREKELQEGGKDEDERNS